MANSTDLLAQFSITNSKTGEIVRMTALLVMLVTFCIFLYFALLLLSVIFATPHVREQSRYVLFAHMIINDTVSLFISVFQFVAAMYSIPIPTVICWVMIIFGKVSFLVTPGNLAVMSLERYVAICHPLRHAEFCTCQRTNAAILVLWGIGLVPVALEFIIMGYLIGKSVLSVNAICYWLAPEVNRVQTIIRLITDSVSFTSVGLVIFYTYIRVLLVARRMTSGKSTASKAGKTVLLHGFQLLLCMSSFTSTITETYLIAYFAFIRITNFLVLFFLPKIISPLVYGMREEVFSKYVKKRLCPPRGRQLFKKRKVFSMNGISRS
uniref:G-protein coupled receptors family 1 profile domain-containing protein n=1 Tax=Xenopus tropicalis TaxID=8364 RepID=A0A1B8Y441_XENTR|eukprot:XP_002942453.1 PREDICTED: olfactory receptor 52A1-like [Xenopus tropicalis]